MKLVTGFSALVVMAIVSTSMAYAQTQDSCSGGCCSGAKTAVTVAAVQEKGSCCSGQEGATCSGQEGTCCSGQEGATCSCQEGTCQGGECPIAAAMTKLPKMVMKVGEETTECASCAKGLADTKKLPIHFVVATKNYEDKTAAYTALVEATESFVDEFATPCTCPTSGVTKIGGTSCDCTVTAGKNAELMKTAMASVQMNYKVGEEVCNCPKKAAAMAKEAGQELQYVVGEQTTCCPLTARMEIAKQKICGCNQSHASNA